MERPWLVDTRVDARLCELTGLTAFDLARVRRRLWTDWSLLPQRERERLQTGGTCPRFAYLNHQLAVSMGPQTWQRWLKHLEHTEQDIHEMGLGEYPISPYLVRMYSALFGIKVDFLLLGTVPAVDKVGANVDIWPLTLSAAKSR